MKEFRRWTENDPHRARRGARILVAFAALLSVYLFVFSPEGWLARRRIANGIQEAREEGIRLRTARAKVLGEIRALGQDPEAMERIARDELGFERPGETTLDPNL